MTSGTSRGEEGHSSITVMSLSDGGFHPDSGCFFRMRTRARPQQHRSLTRDYGAMIAFAPAITSSILNTTCSLFRAKARERELECSFVWCLQGCLQVFKRIRRPRRLAGASSVKKTLKKRLKRAQNINYVTQSPDRSPLVT